MAQERAQGVESSDEEDERQRERREARREDAEEQDKDPPWQLRSRKNPKEKKQAAKPAKKALANPKN